MPAIFLLITVVVIALVAYSFGQIDANRKKQGSTREASENTSSPTVQDERYFDAVRRLTMKLSRNIPLKEWATGIPDKYTQREVESIASVTSQLPGLPASRYVAEPLNNLVREIGLIELAREFKTEAFEDLGDRIWPSEVSEPIISAYLKAWLTAQPNKGTAGKQPSANQSPAPIILSATQPKNQAAGNKPKTDPLPPRWYTSFELPDGIDAAIVALKNRAQENKTELSPEMSQSIRSQFETQLAKTATDKRVVEKLRKGDVTFKDVFVQSCILQTDQMLRVQAGLK